MEEAPKMPDQLRSGQIRRYYSSRRKYQLKVQSTLETKTRVRDAANRLMMSNTEFIEWLMDRWSRGLVIVVEEGAFLDGVMKALDTRADARGAAAGEAAALQALYDRNIIDSPFRK
jgi:hypothetical protein